MPNYCKCFLSISVEDQNANDILQAINGEDTCFDFNRIIPYPEALKVADDASREWERKLAESRNCKDGEWKQKYLEFIENNPRPDDGYNHGGFEWCRENWGTKWNACNPVITEQSEYEIVIAFETAWAPPIPVINALAKMLPTCPMSIEYYERGMAFCGSVQYGNGEIENQSEGKYYGYMGG